MVAYADNHNAFAIGDINIFYPKLCGSAFYIYALLKIMPKISIIIPARNEELSIADTIARLEETLRIDCEIVIVNDHSTDKTKEIAGSLAAKYKNIKVIDNQGPASFVDAFLCGLRNIDSPVFVPVMADLCDEPETINRMYEKINEGYDIVAGSRYMPGGQRMGGDYLKAFFSSFMGKTLHFLIGIPTYDIPNAFKMYRKTIMEDMQIDSVGFEVSAEIPLKAYFKGARITEVPTIWKERKAGRSHFKMFKIGPRYIRLYIWAVLKSIFYPGSRANEV